METRTYYGIRYLRIGEPTMATDKEGNLMKFTSVWSARTYLIKARDTDQNNPVTFMNRVEICELNDNGTVAKVIEKF